MVKVKREISWDSSNIAKHIPSYSSIINNIKKVRNPYLGNKRKLLSFFCKTIQKHKLNFNSFLDAFCGSAVVGLLVKETNRSVISNDLLRLPYQYSLSLIENNNIKLSEEKIDFILFNKNSSDDFVMKNWTKFSDENGRNRFTIDEAKHLDIIKNNINLLESSIEKAIAFSAISLICMKLPFGFIDKSLDIYNHRKKQMDKYGKTSSHHDRRIGIYYDKYLNLNFYEWFPKYVNNIQNVSLIKNNKCKSLNLDIFNLLSQYNNVDCVYFDPPYGGKASKYGDLYQFFEEFITGERRENLTYYENANRFIEPKSYKKNFIQMLDMVENIPIWIFSYNDSSWETLDYIVKKIKKFRSNVIIESESYDYSYRGKKVKNKENEYLILAPKEI